MPSGICGTLLGVYEMGVCDSLLFVAGGARDTDSLVLGIDHEPSALDYAWGLFHG